MAFTTSFVNFNICQRCHGLKSPNERQIESEDLDHLKNYYCHYYYSVHLASQNHCRRLFIIINVLFRILSFRRLVHGILTVAFNCFKLDIFGNIIVPTPLERGGNIYSNGFFLFRQFLPIDIFIVES